MTDSSDPPAESSGESRKRQPVVIDRLTGPDRRIPSVGHRVHIAALRAQLDKLDDERGHLEDRTDRLETEREQLEAEVRSLEARVAELEDRCAVLERAVEYKDSQRQQIIVNYERRLAERREADGGSSDSGQLPARAIDVILTAIHSGGRHLRAALGRLGSVPGR